MVLTFTSLLPAKSRVLLVTMSLHTAVSSSSSELVNFSQLADMYEVCDDLRQKLIGFFLRSLCWPTHLKLVTFQKIVIPTIAGHEAAFVGSHFWVGWYHSVIHSLSFLPNQLTGDWHAFNYAKFHLDLLNKDLEVDC